jgi:ABC-type phosphate transport system substrate-binding protein
MMAAFQRAFGSAPGSGEALVGSAEVVNAIRGTPGGVGFTTLAAARAADLPIATIDGRDAAGGIGGSAYPFYALGYRITLGPPGPILSRFLAFVETRRAELAKHGIVPARDLVP